MSMRTLAIAMSFLLLMATGCKKQNEVVELPENTQTATKGQDADIQQDVAPNGNMIVPQLVEKLRFVYCATFAVNDVGLKNF